MVCLTCFRGCIRANVDSCFRDHAIHFCIDYRAVDVYCGSSARSFEKKASRANVRLTNTHDSSTLFLALVQAIGMCAGLISQGITLTSGLAFYVPAVTSLVAGTMFLMWLGEQITERGVGNGISMIIFAGIVAGLPTLVMQSLTSVDNGQSSLIGLAIFGLLSIAVLAAIVFIEKAQRRIPVNYAQKQQGRRVFTAQQTHLPLKINMAGVIPAILPALYFCSQRA